MKSWDDVTKEELVIDIAPGVAGVNIELKEKLDWFEYLRHFRDMLHDGILNNYSLTREHIQDIFVDIYLSASLVINGTFPELDELSDYIHSQYVNEKIDELTYIAMKITKDNWPAFKEKVCKDHGIDSGEI